jgi:hypothetical protein
VIAALGAKFNVVQVEKYRMIASWDDAPPAIAAQDLTAHRGRHVLPSLGGQRAHVG